jgi:TonB family protein
MISPVVHFAERPSHFSNQPMKTPGPLLLPSLLSLLALSSPVLAQTAPSQMTSASSAVPTPNYPDNTGGLERLGKDIETALRNGESGKAMSLAKSMVLDDPAAWYHSTFGNYSGAKEIAAYEDEKTQLPQGLLGFFKKSMQAGDTRVVATRYESTNCNDNAGEDTFALLQARKTNTAFYDLRLYQGTKYFRLWPIVFQGGTFRLVGKPKPWNYFQSYGGVTKYADVPNNDENAGSRILQGGNVAAAKLLHRVPPDYPGIARDTKVEGKVQLHALIGKDGGIEELLVQTGYCSLAQASLDAVRKWRYSPTLINGQAVEVDTTIDVIFQLRK